MSSLPSDISSLLIPMQGRPWLVPNIVVAEIIPLRQPDRPGHGPEWLLGWLSWRDQNIPQLSFEKLNESGQITIGQDARIAVLNTVAGKSTVEVWHRERLSWIHARPTRCLIQNISDLWALNPIADFGNLTAPKNG